jgi:hypothetical protein
MMEREISDDEIIELAALQRRVDQFSLPEDIAKFEHASTIVLGKLIA